jgi:DsbC/DsbD-like thiol-disulfide interchange protein
MKSIVSALLLLVLSLPALAGGRASPWVDFREARVRVLLAEPKAGETFLQGGVEIRLAPEYKTYWRSPGDSGVPPQADFSGSRGARGFELLFPFPKRFDDGAGGEAWGYKQDVILPFRAERVANEPVQLRLKLDFAVCGTMCIPLQAQFESLSNVTLEPEWKPALARAHGRVPRLLDATETAERIRLIEIGAGAKPEIVIEFRVDEAEKEFELFPEGRAYFSVLSSERIAPDRARARLKAELPPGQANPLGTLRLTFGSKKKAMDASIRLDERRPAP